MKVIEKVILTVGERNLLENVNKLVDNIYQEISKDSDIENAAKAISDGIDELLVLTGEEDE